MSFTLSSVLYILYCINKIINIVQTSQAKVLHYSISELHIVICTVLSCIQNINVDVSFGERERKIHRDPAGNWTRDLLNTSRTLLPLSHWTHGRGAEASLHITAMLEAPADSSCLSLSHRWLHCLVFKWRSLADGVAGLGWIDCTGTLPERILSLSTTPASSSIISRRIVACYTVGLECWHPCKQLCIHANSSLTDSLELQIPQGLEQSNEEDELYEEM